MKNAQNNKSRDYGNFVYRYSKDIYIQFCWTNEGNFIYIISVNRISNKRKFLIKEPYSKPVLRDAKIFFDYLVNYYRDIKDDSESRSHGFKI